MMLMCIACEIYTWGMFTLLKGSSVIEFSSALSKDPPNSIIGVNGGGS